MHRHCKLLSRIFFNPRLLLALFHNEHRFCSVSSDKKLWITYFIVKKSIVFLTRKIRQRWSCERKLCVSHHLLFFNLTIKFFFKIPAAFLETILCVDNKWYELTTYQIFSKNSAWNLQKLWLGGVEEKQMGWCQLKYRLIDWFSLATSSLLWLFFFLKKNFVKSKSCSFNLLHVLFLEKIKW